MGPLICRALKGSLARGEGGQDGMVVLWLDCLPCMEDTSLICTMFISVVLVYRGQTIWSLTIVGDLVRRTFWYAEAERIQPRPKNQEDVMNRMVTTTYPRSLRLHAVKIRTDEANIPGQWCAEPWWRPFVRQFHGNKRGKADVKTLAGIAIMAGGERLATTDRIIVRQVQATRWRWQGPWERAEINSRSSDLLIAGSVLHIKLVSVASDVHLLMFDHFVAALNSSTCAIIYYLAA